MKTNLKTTLTGHNGAIYDLIDIPAEGIFISTGGDGFIVSWERDGSKPDGNLIAQAGKQIFSLGLHKHLLLAGAMSGELIWIDRIEKKILKNAIFHKHGIFDILTIGDAIYTVSGDGCIGKWNPQNMELIMSLRLSNQGLRKIIFDPLRKQLIIGASDHNVYFVDPDSLEVKNHISDCHTNSVFALQILNPDVLITGSRDARTRLFDLNNLALINELPAHLYSINEIINIFDGYATASRDKRIRIWDKNNKLLQSIDFSKDGHLNSVNSLLWMPDKSLLWSCSDDRSIRAFEITK